MRNPFAIYTGSEVRILTTVNIHRGWKRRVQCFGAALLAMSMLAGCGQKDEDNNTSSGDNTAGDSQYHIGFVVHTTSGDVMAAIEYGAKAAAEDYGVKLTYTGPADSDNTQQISMFESLVAAGCDAIVIIAGDSTVWDEPSPPPWRRASPWSSPTPTLPPPSAPRTSA